MTRRLSIRIVLAICAALGALGLPATNFAQAAGTSTFVVSPATGDGEGTGLAVSFHRQRTTTPRKSVDVNSLHLLQPASSGAVTILVESMDETGDMPTADDNDYTRIDDAVQAVAALGDGTMVRLVGTFDWSEEHAFASWVANDYGILAPGGVTNVTISAPELGDAVIIGPGEASRIQASIGILLSMWGGLYQGWTVENLVIRGFDWSLGMYYDDANGGSTDDFNGVTIRNNRIEMHVDTPGNYTEGVGEVYQNIALHLGFGENQTIEGNEIIIPGDGEGDDSDPGAVLKGTCVALQSNTSGGDAYDGLQIIDNTIRITGAQAAVPEIIYGIWENAGAHASNVEVSGNVFVNEHPDNDPSLNFQRAFRVTSHSSETTTVTYADNTVVGANIAIHWIGDNYTSNPPATVLPVVVTGNTLLGNGTGVWVHTDDGGLDPTKMSKAVLSANRVLGNTVGVRSDDAEVTAESNRWVGSEGPGAAGCDDAVDTGTAGFLDSDPWLVLDVDTEAAVVDVGFGTGASASVQTNSDAERLGEIDFPSTEIEFSAQRGIVSSPVLTGERCCRNHVTATDQGIASVTAVLDNSAATATCARHRERRGDGAIGGGIRDTPTLVDNDYTRLNNLVQMVGDGVAVERSRAYSTGPNRTPISPGAWALTASATPMTTGPSRRRRVSRTSPSVPLSSAMPSFRDRATCQPSIGRPFS